jgi:hypothetical protein
MFTTFFLTLLLSFTLHAKMVDNPSVTVCGNNGGTTLMQAKNADFAKAGITLNNMCCFGKGCMGGWTFFGLINRAKNDPVPKAILSYWKNIPHDSNMSAEAFCLKNKGNYTAYVDFTPVEGRYNDASICKFDDNSTILARTLLAGPDDPVNAEFNGTVNKYVGQYNQKTIGKPNQIVNPIPPARDTGAGQVGQ